MNINNDNINIWYSLISNICSYVEFYCKVYLLHHEMSLDSRIFQTIVYFLSNWFNINLYWIVNERMLRIVEMWVLVAKSENPSIWHKYLSTVTYLVKSCISLWSAVFKQFNKSCYSRMFSTEGIILFVHSYSYRIMNDSNVWKGLLFYQILPKISIDQIKDSIVTL